MSLYTKRVSLPIQTITSLLMLLQIFLSCLILSCYGDDIIITHNSGDIPLPLQLPTLSRVAAATMTTTATTTNVVLNAGKEVKQSTALIRKERINQKDANNSLIVHKRSDTFTKVTSKYNENETINDEASSGNRFSKWHDVSNSSRSLSLYDKYAEESSLMNIVEVVQPFEPRCKITIFKQAYEIAGELKTCYEFAENVFCSLPTQTTQLGNGQYRGVLPHSSSNTIANADDVEDYRVIMNADALFKKCSPFFEYSSIQFTQLESLIHRKKAVTDSCDSTFIPSQCQCMVYVLKAQSPLVTKIDTLADSVNTTAIQLAECQAYKKTIQKNLTKTYETMLNCDKVNSEIDGKVSECEKKLDSSQRKFEEKEQSFRKISKSEVTFRAQYNTCNNTATVLRTKYDYCINNFNQSSTKRALAIGECRQELMQCKQAFAKSVQKPTKTLDEFPLLNEIWLYLKYTLESGSFENEFILYYIRVALRSMSFNSKYGASYVNADAVPVFLHRPFYVLLCEKTCTRVWENEKTPHFNHEYVDFHFADNIYEKERHKPPSGLALDVSGNVTFGRIRVKLDISQMSIEQYGHTSANYRFFVLSRFLSNIDFCLCPLNVGKHEDFKLRASDYNDKLERMWRNMRALENENGIEVDGQGNVFVDTTHNGNSMITHRYNGGNIPGNKQQQQQQLQQQNGRQPQQQVLYPQSYSKVNQQHNRLPSFYVIYQPQTPKSGGVHQTTLATGNQHNGKAHNVGQSKHYIDEGQHNSQTIKPLVNSSGSNINSDVIANDQMHRNRWLQGSRQRSNQQFNYNDHFPDRENIMPYSSSKSSSSSSINGDAGVGGGGGISGSLSYYQELYNVDRNKRFGGGGGGGGEHRTKTRKMHKKHFAQQDKHYYRQRNGQNHQYEYNSPHETDYIPPLGPPLPGAPLQPLGPQSPASQMSRQIPIPMIQPQLPPLTPQHYNQQPNYQPRW